MMCTVVNKYKEEYDIYIGRGSPYGNPFVIGKDDTREEVIEKFRLFLWEQIKKGVITKEHLIQLNGKRLGCFCKPQARRGDIVAKAVECACSK